MATTGRGDSGRGSRKTSGTRQSIREARAAYDARDEAVRLRPATGVTVTRLSSKNQITVPVVYVRALELQAGDEVQVMVVGDMIVLQRHPRTAEEWEARLCGSMSHVPEWRTAEDIDAWVRRERDSWDREWDRDESS